jgi:hypothetical protein
MKTIKMSLANIQGKLSRAEMKNVVAGETYDPSIGYNQETLDPNGEGGECDAAKTYPRIEACKGKDQGDPCEYTLNGSWYYHGTCVWTPLAVDKYCFVGY